MPNNGRFVIMSDSLYLYTTDNKVKMYSTEEEVNSKLASVLGDRFTEYRKKFLAATNFELETDFPLYLNIELHQICNLKCPMCSIGNPAANEKYVSDKKMSWDTYEKIILEAEKYGCPSVCPQGTNEPLLTPDLEKYIKFAANHGFIDIMMNSNATLLTEERARMLLKSGLTRIRFSLDAFTKETYQKIRIGADFDRTMTNIDRFLKIKKDEGYDLPVVGVNFCKMKINEHEVNDFIDNWKDRVDFVAIQSFTPPELQSDYNVFIPSDSEFNQSMLNDFHCQQPWQRVYIKNNGEVCPCCTFFNEELTLGNISKNTIHELWNGVQMKSLRQLHKEGRFYENPWCLNCVKCTTGVSDIKFNKK